MNNELKDITWCTTLKGTFGIGVVEYDGKLQLRGSVIDCYSFTDDSQMIIDCGGLLDIATLKRMIRTIEEQDDSI